MRVRRRNTVTAVRPSGLTVSDLAGEVMAGLFARPGRLVLTIVGTAVGLAALVATLGLSRTANNRIIGRFDALAATEILITPQSGPDGPTPFAIPWDAPERLLALNGAVAAGTISVVDVGNALVSTSPVRDPSGQTQYQLSVQAASPGLFDAVRAELRVGRQLDPGHSVRAERVALLGPGAALKLGISGVAQQPAIAIGDDLFVVIGILDDVARQVDLLGAIIIPEGTARQKYGLQSPEAVVVETAIGAARLIGAQAPLALRPDQPSVLKVAAPQEPQRVRDNVQGDLNVLFLLLGGVSLLVGAIGIANVTLVSVMERTGEIGLRRALGASRRHIALQFLAESTAMGLIGGIVGASVGTLVVVAVSAVQQWTPVLDPAVPFAAPLIGALVGLGSGTYPSLRASRMEPVEALRAGT